MSAISLSSIALREGCQCELLTLGKRCFVKLPTYDTSITLRYVGCVNQPRVQNACGNGMSGGSWAFHKVSFYRSDLLFSESNPMTLKNWSAIFYGAWLTSNTAHFV